MVLYKCIYCQQKFIYKGNYVSHNKNINKCKIKLEESIDKYKTYTNEKLLNDLNNLILNDESKYKCKICDKIYNSYNSLKRHKLMQCNIKEQIINKAIVNNTIESSTIIHRAVYKELDTGTDNNSLYVGSIELNKDKLRGFFRKAASLLKRKTDQPTDKSFSE